MQPLRRCDQLFLVLLQRQHCYLDGSKPGIEVQHGAPLLILARWWLFLVGVQQQVEEGAVYAARSLDDPGNVALLGFGIGIAQILAAKLAVTREVPVLSPVDALPFLPAKHGLVFDIEGLFRVVRQFVRPMCAEAQAILVVDDALVPLKTPLFPVIKPLLHLAGMHEELQIPLLELALAEQEVARRDLVAEGLPDLANAKRYLHARGLQYVFVVQVDVLARFTAQVGLHALALDHADVGFHHQVEGARLGQFATTDRAFVLRQVLRWQVIDAETAFAILAVHQPVDKVLDMPAGLPHTRMGDDRALDADDVIVGLHHRPPPEAADIVAQFDAERPEVINAGDPAVNLRVGVDKAASLTKRDDLLNGDERCVFCGQGFVLCLCHEWFPPQKNSPDVFTTTSRDESMPGCWPGATAYCGMMRGSTLLLHPRWDEATHSIQLRSALHLL